MKAQAIIAAAALVSSAAAFNAEIHHNYNQDADPCNVYQRKQCKDAKFCVWTDKPRNLNAGKHERKFYGQHTAKAGQGSGSCAMIHMHDRDNLPSNEKNELKSKFNVGASWGEMSCSDAFWLKDCKDINQHFASSGSNKCEWNCDSGCVDASSDNAQAVNPYADCTPCTPLVDSPPNRVKCNDACNICVISANVNKYPGKYLAGALVMKGKEGDEWVRVFETGVGPISEPDNFGRNILDKTRDHFRGNGGWGVVKGEYDGDPTDSDIGDGTNSNYSFQEMACKALGYPKNALRHYSDPVLSFDEDVNMAAYEGGPAWRLAGLHDGYLDATDGNSGYDDGDYVGGHDYMDYLDYNEAAYEFPWLIETMAPNSRNKVVFMNTGADCRNSPATIWDCDWTTVGDLVDYQHYAQAIVCCSASAPCEDTDNLVDLFANEVFQPWNDEVNY
jgi:hypothetical protein